MPFFYCKKVRLPVGAKTPEAGTRARYLPIILWQICVGAISRKYRNGHQKLLFVSICVTIQVLLTHPNTTIINCQKAYKIRVSKEKAPFQGLFRKSLNGPQSRDQKINLHRHFLYVVSHLCHEINPMASSFSSSFDVA